MLPTRDILRASYVVLLGDVGTGKSTVVERLTGAKGRSSDASQSYTKISEVFWVPDGSLIVSDTPGSNTMTDKLLHNTWIAEALNFRPVSRIFIVVKAEARMDSVVDNVRKYADRFVELPEDVVGVLVTHMDIVRWTKEKFTSHLDKELGIDTVVFSWLNTTGETLLHDILETCTETHDLTVNSENFFRLFKIHNNHRKILQLTSDEMKNFQGKKKAFDEARKAYSGKDLVDLVFEFQAYMTHEITKAQERFAKDNGFTFEGDGRVKEAGHLANMANQLRMVLYDIRKDCDRLHSEHGASESRKCPYCGLIWTKMEGCDGDTTCGNRPDAFDKQSAFSVQATYSFLWNNSKLTVTPASRWFGCGNTINWKRMAPVSVPSEFSETVKVCTSDAEMLPPIASGFKKGQSSKLGQAQRGSKLSERPIKNAAAGLKYTRGLYRK